MGNRRFLSKSEVRSLVKLSYAEIARREKQLRFPSRLRLGPYRNSRSVWIEDEVLAWIEDQIARARYEVSR